MDRCPLPERKVMNRVTSCVSSKLFLHFHEGGNYTDLVNNEKITLQKSVVLGLLLSRRWRASINFLVFSTTDSKWIVRTPPSFENVYWTLYYIITRARLKFCTLSSVFYMLRTAGRGNIVKTILKTHTTDHFMPLGILIASFILAAIRVSFEKMSMKEHPDLDNFETVSLIER